MELTDELAGDEHVTGEPGDDDGCRLEGVGDSKGDGVAAACLQVAVGGDLVAVDVGGGSDGPVGWSCFGCLLIDTGGGFAAYGPMGPLVVVDVAESVELCL